MSKAKDIIQHLQLLPHPEGGYYKEVYRSTEMTTNTEGKSRNVCTSIYYLLEEEDKSHLHRIKSDELWFFHEGTCLEIVYIQNGEWKTILLGNNPANGEVPQACIPAGNWFGSKVKDGKGYALVSCTVAPGFDFEDFEMAEREELLEQYPDLSEPIISFTC